MIPNNARTLRITAAAGTKLAGASSFGTINPTHYLHVKPSPQPKELYNPKAFIAHTASHHQGFPHCEWFSTAASRRSLGSISVPVLAVNLSVRLDVLALVRRYHTN